MKKYFAFLSLVLLTATMSFADTQLPAFPGAEGGGRYTTGGRGGKVYFVTSLSDENKGNSSTREGTLRWCVGQTGPRIIVFKVSGIIELKIRLNISNGDLTIAGQTAPGDGICIKDNSVCVKADNVIIRYMRFRPGDATANFEDDAVWGRWQKNIILDHCSMSFSVDECASFYGNQNFTMQWCLLAESLNNSQHVKGAHGYGGLWGGENATFHHNMLAHHNNRNARLNGWKRLGLDYAFGNTTEESVDYRNNVIYNWGGNSTYGGEAGGKYNMVNNYYKYGPATSVKNRLVQMDKDAQSVVIKVHGKSVTTNHGVYYLDGNYMYGDDAVTSNNWSTRGIKNNSGASLADCKTTEPFECEPVPTHTAEDAFEKVLAYAGACLSRDAQDARVAEEAEGGFATYTGSVTGKAGLIDTPSDVGGYCVYNAIQAPKDSDRDGIPDDYEFSHDLSPSDPDDANDIAPDGYTWIEHYLNGLVAAITEAEYEGAVSSSIDRPRVPLADAPEVAVEDGYLHVRSARPVREVQIIAPDGRLVAVETCQGAADFRLPLTDVGSKLYVVRVVAEDGSTFHCKRLNR